MRAPSGTLIVILLLLAAGLAGCASPAAETVAPANATVVFAEDYTRFNATVPRDELQQATLGAEHVHDLWNGAESLVLLDATLDAGFCEGPQDGTFQVLQTAFFGEGVATGCARIALPEGVVVPEGTGELVVAVDATDALKAGSMVFEWRNKAREIDEDATAEAVHEWRVALTADDWDLPHAKATTFVMYVTSRGPVGALTGTLHATVTAVKAPGWAPILAVAHVDHWKLPALHDFPAPGVMRLFDGEVSVTNVDPARFLDGGSAETPNFTDIVPPGTTTVTLVVDRVSTDCAPALDCWFVPGLVVGGYERQRFGELVHAEGERRVYAWAVPDEVPEDSVYAEVSTTRIDPRIDACAAGQEPTCGFASIASGSATARVQAFAWKDAVDLTLLTQIADAAGASR